MYDNKCPDCGAYLDACEKCDCKKEKTATAATVAARPLKVKTKSIESISRKKTSVKSVYRNSGYVSCKDESEAQAMLITWTGYMQARYPELKLLYHIPNEGKRSKATGARLVRMGLKKGVPDLCLPVARGKWHGLYIEMKADGGKPMPEQEEWLSDLRAQGYLCIVSWSFEYARDCIMNYLKEK